VQPGSAIRVNLSAGETKQAALAIKNSGNISGVAQAYLSVDGFDFQAAVGEWTSENNYPIALADASLTYLNGKYYAFGGQDAASVYAKAYRYDPASPGWQPLPDLPSPRAYHTAIALNGKIYLIGGWNSAHALLSSVDVYDPQTNTWSSAAPVTDGYLGPGVTVMDGKLYVLGGAEQRDNGLGGKYFSPENNFYRYDPAGNTWTTLTNLFDFNGFWDCLSKSSTIYCAGGYNAAHPGFAGSLTAGLVSYDLAHNSSIYKTNMLARHAQAASATAWNRLYVTGGVSSAAVGIQLDSSDGEFYEPEVDRWVQVPGIGDVRGAAGACGLMAIGGQSSSGVYYNKTWRLNVEGLCDPQAIPWLSIDQSSFTLDPGATGTLHLMLNSSGLADGVYTAHLTIITDSPYPYLDVPVTLVVGKQKTYLPAVMKP
jgi:N-acetylneuraminic acid mutarotase